MVNRKPSRIIIVNYQIFENEHSSVIKQYDRNGEVIRTYFLNEIIMLVNENFTQILIPKKEVEEIIKIYNFVKIQRPELLL